MLSEGNVEVNLREIILDNQLRCHSYTSLYYKWNSKSIKTMFFIGSEQAYLLFHTGCSYYLSVLLLVVVIIREMILN